MNPVSTTRIQTPPVLAFGRGQAANAFSQGVSPRFGNAAGKAAAEGAEQLSRWATARAFAKYYVDGENKQAVKAMVWEYGIPTGIGLTALIPVVGWGLALVGIPFAIWSARRGGKMREKLAAGASKGPFLRLAEMKTLYGEATDYKKVKEVKQTHEYAGKIANKARELVDELFPDQDHQHIKNLQRAVNRLKPKEGGAAERLVASSLEVQFNYRNKFAGRALRILNKTIGKIKFKPIQLPVLALKSILVGSLMIMNRKTLANSLRTLA